MSFGIGPRDDIGLIVLAVPHDIRLYFRSKRQKNLAPRWVALRVLNSRKRLGRVSSAVENDLSGVTGEGCLKVGKLLSNESDPVVPLQPLVEVEQMLGSIDC